MVLLTKVEEVSSQTVVVRLVTAVVVMTLGVTMEVLVVLGVGVGVVEERSGQSGTSGLHSVMVLVMVVVEVRVVVPSMPGAWAETPAAAVRAMRPAEKRILMSCL